MSNNFLDLDKVLNVLKHKGNNLTPSKIHFELQSKNPNLNLNSDDIVVLLSNLEKENFVSKNSNSQYSLSGLGLKYPSYSSYHDKISFAGDLDVSVKMATIDALKGQENYGKWSLRIAGITGFFILISTYQQCSTHLDKKVQEMKLVMQETNLKLDSIRISVQSLNHSIQNLKKDSSKK